jgi:hypothetical protein
MQVDVLRCGDKACTTVMPRRLASSSTQYTTTTVNTSTRLARSSRKPRPPGNDHQATAMAVNQARLHTDNACVTCAQRRLAPVDTNKPRASWDTGRHWQPRCQTEGNAVPVHCAIVFLHHTSRQRAVNGSAATYATDANRCGGCMCSLFHGLLTIWARKLCRRNCSRGESLSSRTLQSKASVLPVLLSVRWLRGRCASCSRRFARWLG